MADHILPRDFTDTRVFVVGANDPRTHRLHELDHLGCEQACDGPNYIVVGPNVSDDKLLRNLPKLSSRYGVTLAQLQAVRDHKKDVLTDHNMRATGYVERVYKPA